MIPDDLSKLLAQCGRLIADADWRPQPPPEVLLEWDANIEAWIADRKKPLFVRRSSLPRGTVLVHDTGRQLVPTDNTPAHWVFAQAVSGASPQIKEVTLFEIPVAMAIKRSEKETATYLSSGRKGLLNDWKLCHIEPVKVGRGDISTVPIQSLEDQLRRFLKPSNMFMVPKAIGGLGEIPDVIDAVRAAMAR